MARPTRLGDGVFIKSFRSLLCQERATVIELMARLAQSARQGERLQLKLQRIDAALARIEEGSYGRCTTCSAPISPERLARLPYAELCFGCQRGVERNE